jgi:excisionase family DNA binding protein
LGGVTKKAYTTGEVASLTGLSQQTVIRCFDKGRLQGFRVPGSASRRIPRASLIQFMKAHQIPIDGVAAPTLRVLLIDDDSGNIDVITQTLESFECVGLDVASSAWEAGLLAASTSPDLAIVSARMPDLDVDLVCRTLRESAQFNAVRLIVLARRFRQRELTQLQLHGVEAFWRPPLVGQQILDLLPATVTG